MERYQDITPYRPFYECFKESDKVTAQHILWEHYCKGEGSGLSKFVFYLALHRKFGQPVLKDERGNLGYAIEFIPKPENT